MEFRPQHAPDITPEFPNIKTFQEGLWLVRDRETGDKEIVKFVILKEKEHVLDGRTKYWFHDKESFVSGWHISLAELLETWDIEKINLDKYPEYML